MFEAQDRDITPESMKDPEVPNPEVKATQSKRRFTAKEKLRILAEVDNCAEPGEVGSLLRREGIYSSYLARWRKEKESGQLDATVQRKRGRKPKTQDQNQQELARLRAENQKLQEQLKKAEAVIEIQKKLSILLGSEESTNDN